MTRGRPRRRESAYLVCHRTSRMLNCLLLILLLFAKTTTDAWMTVAPSFSWLRRARSPSCQHGPADGAASVAASSSRTLLRAGVTPPSSQEEHSHHHSGATALDDVYYANQFATGTPPLEATAAATPLLETAAVSQQQQQPESSSAAVPRITLTRFLDQAVEENPELRDLQSLLLGLQMACKTISHLVNRAGLVYTAGTSNNASPVVGKNYTTSHNTPSSLDDNNGSSDKRLESMKRLDQLSTLVLQNALLYTGKCRDVIRPTVDFHEETPAEHQPGVLIAQMSRLDDDDQDDSPYQTAKNNRSSSSSSSLLVLDPLDGSGNADASVCTGTLFGVFRGDDGNTDDNHNTTTTSDTDAMVRSVLQPAQNMRAAGYCLYSSATLLVFALEKGGVQGFTLDPQWNDFVLTHPNMTCPPQGSVYSCNEGNSESGWSDGWKAYLKAIKTGTGRSRQRYTQRYCGSMVGDVHRTLLYGGIFAYPSNEYQPAGNLQLLYKTAPLAYILDRAGGRGTDGRGHSLLQVTPERVHQKSPCYMGSANDIDELETYLYQPPQHKVNKEEGVEKKR